MDFSEAFKYVTDKHCGDMSIEDVTIGYLNRAFTTVLLILLLILQGLNMLNGLFLQLTIISILFINIIMLIFPMISEFRVSRLRWVRNQTDTSDL